jgi:hypothetical protein
MALAIYAVWIGIAPKSAPPPITIIGTVPAIISSANGYLI